MPDPRDNEHSLYIAALRVSELRLYRDQRFRGYCILWFTPWDATSLESLSDEEYQAFLLDLRNASKAIRASLRPDHMNYELLGNSNPHLHWHVIPRYRSDPRWGQPIWEGWPRNEFNTNRHVLSDGEYNLIVEAIRGTLS